MNGDRSWITGRLFEGSPGRSRRHSGARGSSQLPIVELEPGPPGWSPRDVECVTCGSIRTRNYGRGRCGVKRYYSCRDCGEQFLVLVRS